MDGLHHKVTCAEIARKYFYETVLFCLQSVLHENVYRDPVAKHCYGAESANQLQL